MQSSCCSLVVDYHGQHLRRHVANRFYTAVVVYQQEVEPSGNFENPKNIVNNSAELRAVLREYAAWGLSKRGLPM